MPWNNNGSDDGSGGGSGGPSPWGTPGGRPGGRPGGPRGPGGPTPPDMEEVIARLQGFLRGMLPPGFGGPRGPRPPRGPGGPRGAFSGGRGFAMLAMLAIVLWLVSGTYRVEPDEQGVVMRFGAYVRTSGSGLNWHFPWPIETVLLPAVTRINRVEIGYRSTSDVTRQQGSDEVTDVPAESLMLTGDENIIDINFAVFWRVRDAGAYLFNTRNPAGTVKSAAESVMREVIGSTPIEPALTGARSQIEVSVMKGVQAILDQYKTGVELTQVQLLKSGPPDEVIESFRDVQRASTDAERMRNEAESYRNDIVPRARGDRDLCPAKEHPRDDRDIPAGASMVQDQPDHHHRHGRAEMVRGGEEDVHSGR